MTWQEELGKELRQSVQKDLELLRNALSMNYMRKLWEKRQKDRNPIAKELSKDMYKPKRIPNYKREHKINPRDIERFFDDQYKDD